MMAMFLVLLLLIQPFVASARGLPADADQESSNSFISRNEKLREFRSGGTAAAFQYPGIYQPPLAPQAAQAGPGFPAAGPMVPQQQLQSPYTYGAYPGYNLASAGAGFGYPSNYFLQSAYGGGGFGGGGFGGGGFGGGGFGQCGMANNYRCPSGECIPRWNVCDGRSDCRGGIDERSCGASWNPFVRRQTRYCQPPNYFLCGNRNCLPRTNMCNGFNECGDNTDELSCSGGGVGGYGGLYGQGYGGYGQQGYGYPGYGYGSTYPGYDQYGLGYGQYDIYGGYGTAVQPVQPGIQPPQPGAPPAGQQCRSEEIPCYAFSGSSYIIEKCIPQSSRCNGLRECSDGSDEQNCGGTTSSGSGQNCIQGTDFQCKNGQCIPLTKRCDQKSDCLDGSDESNCSSSSGSNRSRNSKRR